MVARLAPVSGVFALILFLGGCSGGMSETESDSATGGETSASSSSSSSSTSSTSSTTTTNLSAQEAAANIEAEIDGLWDPPNRPNNVAARDAVVTLYFNRSGRVTRWEFHRRSGHMLFNDNITEFLDLLIETPRQFDLPAEGTSGFDAIMHNGVRVRFADDDA